MSLTATGVGSGPILKARYEINGGRASSERTTDVVAGDQA